MLKFLTHYFISPIYFIIHVAVIGQTIVRLRLENYASLNHSFEVIRLVNVLLFRRNCERFQKSLTGAEASVCLRVVGMFKPYNFCVTATTLGISVRKVITNNDLYLLVWTDNYWRIKLSFVKITYFFIL